MAARIIHKYIIDRYGINTVNGMANITASAPAAVGSAAAVVGRSAEDAAAATAATTDAADEKSAGVDVV